MSQGTTEEDVLTFEELRSITKKAKKSDKLQKLGSNFFQRVSDYLERKKQLDEKLAKVESKNAKKLFEDLLDARENKLIKLATISAKSDLNIDNIHRQEQDLFERVRASVKQHRQQIEQLVYEEETGTEGKSEEKEKKVEAEGSVKEKGENNGQNESERVEEKEKSEEEGSEGEQRGKERKETAVKDEKDGLSNSETDEANNEEEESEEKKQEVKGNDKQAKGEEETEEKKERENEVEESKEREEKGERDEEQREVSQDEPEAEADVTYKKVKITDEIPQFLGTDLKVYGPYHAGDAPEIPAKNAQVLVKRDRAEVLEDRN